jgi:Flp pilus assembly protein TadG
VAVILGLRLRSSERGAAAVMFACAVAASSVYVLLIALFLAGVGDPEIR